MGWSSGSEIMSLIIQGVKDKMDPEDRDSFYKDLIEYFENEDCDTLYECLEQDIVFDKAYKSYSTGLDVEEELDWDDQDNTTF